MSELMTLDYRGAPVAFTDDGWFNATSVAERFGKRPIDWLKLESTKEYVSALQEMFPEVKNLHITRKGNSKNFEQGTWLHPKLAVRFAQWLDVRFAVWCDVQIDALLKGTHPRHDWKRLRHEASSSYRVMNAVLAMQRELQGKSVARHHFMNEARLVNWVLRGKFEGIDRESLTADELDMLARLEERNAVLIGAGLSRDERKEALTMFAADWRAMRTPKLSAPARRDCMIAP